MTNAPGDYTQIQQEAQNLKSIAETGEGHISQLIGVAKNLGRDLEEINENASEIIKIVFQEDSLEEAFESGGGEISDLDEEERKEALKRLEVVMDDTQSSENIESEIEQLEEEMEEYISKLKEEIRTMKKYLDDMEEHEEVIRARAHG